jgi:hypothetical protein
MAATKITKQMFSGEGKIFDGTLEKIIRGIAADLALSKIEQALITDFTDNSTGTAATSFVDLVIPTAAFDATSANGASRANWNTAVTKILNGTGVIAKQMNLARVRIGLPLLSWVTATIASAGTIPAQDLNTSTAVSGASALDFTDGAAKMLLLKKNMRVLVIGFQELLKALGYTTLANTFAGSFSPGHPGYALVDVPAAAASATGASAISKTVADAFLQASANNMASLARAWNDIMDQGTAISDLTDSTGGSSAAGIVVNALPAPANGAATTSSPKAGFDAELVIFANSHASLTSRMNALRTILNLPRYTDSSGGTATTTLAANSNNLTAVDGSSGSVAVDQVTARARMVTVANNLSSLAAGINEVRAAYGFEPLTDTVAGVKSTTIAAITATATGVSGAGATLLDADVDTWLGINRNNLATLAKGLNDVTDTNMTLTKPLSVIAQ